jgi:hypothetical protein
MTNRATLEALLARVLEGEGPDRELDGEIVAALFGGEIVWKTARYTMDAYPVRRIQNSAYVGGYQNAGVLAYTESLDAAIRLVPEGRDWHVQSNPSIGACWASISPAKHGLKLREWGSGMVKAATPARALIAACLKARMEALGE